MNITVQSAHVAAGMDWLFTQEELRWLDDVMPEANRRESEDLSVTRKISVAQELVGVAFAERSGLMQVPLHDGEPNVVRFNSIFAP